MRRLSSSYTFFYKRIFPVFWIGFVLLFFSLQIWLPQHARAGTQPPELFPLVLMPLLMMGVMFFIYRKLIADLMDEVSLDGDWLVVKNRSQQTRVALRDVMNINATTMTNPRRITVMLRTDSRLGRSFSFMPASPRLFISAFKPDPIATELIQRVDALRGASR